MTGRLRGWRRTTRTTDEAIEISAEKGYLREFGNIVFHFSLLGLLVAVAGGQAVRLRGQRHRDRRRRARLLLGLPGGVRLVPRRQHRRRHLAGPDLPAGQRLRRQLSADRAGHRRSPPTSTTRPAHDLAAGTWRPYRLEVNHPLRVSGDRIYLQGHGYAPTFTVTFPDGQTRSADRAVAPRRPAHPAVLGRDAVRPAGRARYPDAAAARASTRSRSRACSRPTEQLHGTLLSSSFPALNDPAVAVDIYRGDTGLDTGRPQSLFTLDPRLIEQKRLTKAGAGQPARRSSRPGSTTAPSSVSTAPCRSSTCRCPTTRRRYGCWCSR